jgi:hypothetical protein
LSVFFAEISVAIIVLWPAAVVSLIEKNRFGNLEFFFPGILCGNITRRRQDRPSG